MYFSGGNVTEGVFEANKLEGPVTVLYPDGRAYVGVLVEDANVGPGVRWSADRQQATSMLDGFTEQGALSLEEAAAFAADLGLPVPPGFTITTEVCTRYYDNGRTYPDTLGGQVADAVARIEAETGARFADPGNPLLVSVRSGARASMPGMMDTVLNLGLNDDTVAGLARRADDKRFAYDS